MERVTGREHGEGVKRESRKKEPGVAARIIPGDEVTLRGSQER